MDTATRDLVRRRASDRCEYCGIPQPHVASRFQIEHIVARQDRGSDDPSNLALDGYKGTNLSAIDPVTGNIVPVFQPRQNRWHSHFALRGSAIVGLTEIGRATIELLVMNAPRRMELRAELGSVSAPQS